MIACHVVVKVFPNTEGGEGRGSFPRRPQRLLAGKSCWLIHPLWTPLENPKKINGRGRRQIELAAGLDPRPLGGGGRGMPSASRKALIVVQGKITATKEENKGMEVSGQIGDQWSDPLYNQTNCCPRQGVLNKSKGQRVAGNGGVFWPLPLCQKGRGKTSPCKLCGNFLHWRRGGNQIWIWPGVTWSL